MSWVKSLVRKAAAVTTGKVFGGSPPPAAAVAAATASVAAGGGAGAAAATGAGAGAGAAAAPTVLASDELERLRAENAKMKHTFHVIKLKLDKAGKASAVADGAGTPAASVGAQSNQEIRDIIARVMAQEKQRVSAAAAASRHRSGSDDAGAAADAAASAGADAALAASISASEAGAPAAAAAAATAAAATGHAAAAGAGAGAGATAAPAAAMAASTLSASTASLSAAGVTGSATVEASAPPAPPAADANDAFAAAQKDKYGAADGKSDAKAATPVAMYYGEDVYSSKEEAEKQAGVKLLCYGNLGVAGGGKRVVARDPRFASAVFASDELGSDEEEVIIVDLDETATTAAPTTADGADANWWTVVDNPNPKESADDAAELAKQEAEDQFKEEPALHLEGPRGTAADGFALVEQEDMINAISEYSAQCVRRFAGAKQLDPQSLQRMLQTTFAQVEPPSTVGRLWQYGQLAYTGYGWASYAYYLYSKPAVWRGAYSVVKWVLVLLV